MPRSKTTPLDTPDNLGGHRVNIANLEEATLVACSLVNSAILVSLPPVQQATKFEFIINLKAAKQIGLTIPVRVLERANDVIK